MDGGIIDNQATDPIVRASEQMATQGASIDLLMVSDAADKNMKAYSPAGSSRRNKKRAIWKSWLLKSLQKMTLKRIQTAALGTAIASVIVIVLLGCAFPFIAGFLSLLLVISLLSWWALKRGQALLTEGAREYLRFVVSVDAAFKVKFLSVWHFFANRAKSAYVMANGAMMGNIRRQRLGNFYADDWKNRIVLNAIYGLKEEGSWQKSVEKNRLDGSLIPSYAIIENSEKANRMDTTLWFTEEDFSNDIPQTLVACGQYTICWNLIKFWKSRNGCRKSNNLRLCPSSCPWKNR